MNLEELDSSLDKHYKNINKIILSRQDAITGLLPASTAINAHGDYTDAWVRDNVYSIMSVWGLALAYKKHNPQNYRTHLLSQSVVKLMRGLLVAMMRQANKIETYKKTHNPIDALHAKYSTTTGLGVVGDDEWGHLQLDATSIFILMIAQMSASGLKIIYTCDEVDFVQNLVHYIGRTYCTPDYGIWERGNKINHGTTEVNCSSVGMAKAALEAISGFNLFGDANSLEGVIHVLPNDIARSRLTLQGLLPRESNSKETDAALLSIIGYPAYAVEDEALVKKTRKKIIKKLGGRYGCKRFLLDGHQSSIEDSTRLHYEPSELRDFEHIESEWPLFFTYLLLDALMREDKEDIQLWREKLEPLFVEENGVKLLPELFIVPKELIEAEKANPGSVDRVANENLPLVWAQSLYMLSDMILDGILEINDIDPLKRRERIGHATKTEPRVCILAENEIVRDQLFDLGISSQTSRELDDVRVMHASELCEIQLQLGENEKLGLTGRHLSVARTISTSRLYLVKGQKVIFLPYYFDTKSFYLGFDNRLLIEHFKSSLRFLAKHWDEEGQPLITFLVREDMLLDKSQDEVIELLRVLQENRCEALEIKTGTLERLLEDVSVEKVDLDLNVVKNISYKNEAYNNAIMQHDWAELRRIAQESGKFEDSLEDSLLDIIISQKRLAVGRAYTENAIFSQPRENMLIVQTINEYCGHNTAEGVLTQEIIVHLGQLIRGEPELFTNMITLRTWDFIQLLVGHISREKQISIGDAYERLLSYMPHEIFDTLRLILKSYTSELTKLHELEHLHVHGVDSVDEIKIESLTQESLSVDDWALWREEVAMIGAIPITLYEEIWHILQQCKGLVIGDKYSIQNRIGSELTLESTAGERSFDLKIDTLLQSIEVPAYRQLNIELIDSLAKVLRQTPQLKVENDLVLDILIGYAVRIAWNKQHDNANYDEQKGQAWEAFYKLSYTLTQESFIEAFKYLISEE
jgi:hypothetical protein